MSRIMKDSGIPWIGEIPKEWKTEKFKHVFRIKKVLAGELGYDVLSVTQKGLRVKDITSNEGQVANDYTNYQRVHPNDFVMNHMDLLTGYVDVAKQEGVTSPDYRTFYSINADSTNNQYYLYIFQFCYKTRLFYNLGQGVSQFGRWRLPAEQQNEFVIPVPSYSEQQRIAEILDTKCGEIDETIVLQEEFIEELKAYKQSVITEAVTRGLNPNVKYKDSGIDWIGMIPERWHLSFLKNYYCFEKGKNASLYTKEYIGAKTGCYPVYSGQTGNNGIMGFIDSYDYDIDECVFTTTVGAKVMTPKILRGKFSLSQNCLIMKRKTSNVSNRFVYYWLHPLFNYCKSLIPTYMQPSLRIEDLQTYCMLFPPIDEQQQIADYLDSKCTEIDSIITIKQRKIEELKDYKKSVIYEYVTGKKEVNG